MVIYMDQYRKNKAATTPVALHFDCDEELLCVNWNPAIRVIAMSCYQSQCELSPTLPEDFSIAGTTEFLDRVHALATQI